ncbi:hypothetical protein Tco_0085604 [Tanacetum coccineum]
MVPATAPLIGFSGEIIWPIGQISLSVKIGDTEHLTSTRMNFVVVRSPSPYNGIIGIREARSKENSGSLINSSWNVKIPSLRRNSHTTKIKVAIHPEYPEQTIAIGYTLTEEGRKELCSLLRRNLDIFAWKPTDMTGVLRHVAEHRLNVREGCPPDRQKKRSQAPERNKEIQDEVERRMESGIMKEVHYQSWLSNLEMVKKHEDSWRMCVDFKNLNKAFLKDGYLLLEIDWKVESLC